MTGLQLNWQAWIFDLDDTLLDTSRELIPAASRKVCEFLVSQKASPSVTQCLERWSHWRTQLSGTELIYKLIERGTEKEKIWLAQKAYGIFRAPEVPPSLSLTPGGKELLELASPLFPLFLVTQGDIHTQIKKVEVLNIISYFKHVFYIDPFAGESKQHAFTEILAKHQFTPQRVLSIGNRLNNEIALSKREGIQTCYVRFGEHSFENPMTAEEIPDLEIASLNELVALLSKKGMAL